MSAGTDNEIAEAMLRIHGRKALLVGEEHALRHRGLDEMAAHDKWQRVSQLIQETITLQSKNEAS